MGQLTLPSAGSLYVDTNAVIYRVTRTILESAAQLRAGRQLKTPDAIHAATALAHGSSLFVSNDVAFRRVAGLPVAVLREVAAS